MAESIEGFTIYGDYTEDINKFTHTLANQLNADLSISLYDAEARPVPEASRLTHYDKREFHELNIFNQSYEFEEGMVLLPTYQLRLSLEGSPKKLDLIFYPNHLLEIKPLAFENNWQSFIDTLKFRTEGHVFSIKDYNTRRREYAHLLKHLGVSEIFIVSTEMEGLKRLRNVTLNPKIDNEQIPHLIQTFEDLFTFRLESILWAKDEEETGEMFLETAEKNIILRDQLKFKDRL